MRKTLALLVTALCYFSASAQEAEVSGNKMPELTIIPRIDVNPYIPVGKNGMRGVDFGNSSLYTLLEGSVGNFSYSMSNHWLSTDPAALYRNSLRTDDSTWLDWLTFTYSTGGFSVTLGKNYTFLGSYELDPMDVEVHYNLSSTFWNNIVSYQWGGSIAYTTPDEASTVALQFSTSPFGERPFASKLFAYSLYWAGEYGCWSPIWSANFMEWERGRFVSILALGNRFDAGPVAFEVDYMNRATSVKRFFDQEMLLTAKVAYNHHDRLEVFAKCGYERRHGEEDMFGYGDDWEVDGTIVPTGLARDRDYIFYGAGAHWWPLRGSQDLRLHAVVAANNYARSVSVSVGATYFFNLTQAVLSKKNRQ